MGADPLPMESAIETTQHGHHLRVCHTALSSTAMFVSKSPTLVGAAAAIAGAGVVSLPVLLSLKGLSR
jgi:hypothetical protein